MMNNQAKDAILAIGALAEVCGEFYKQLLTSEYVKAAITKLTLDNSTIL